MRFSKTMFTLSLKGVKMTTPSNKTYSVQLYKDLSQIYSITDRSLLTSLS